MKPLGPNQITNNPITRHLVTYFTIRCHILPYMQIDLAMYLMGRDKQYPPSDILLQNAAILILRVNNLLLDLPEHVQPTHITSGYRPGHYNAKFSPRSAHTTCQAVDLHDPKQLLSGHLNTNQDLLIAYELFMEDPRYTATWCHLQIRPTRRRVFIPF